MHWDVAACTDKGVVRPINEDSFRISPERNLFVLSDGMGGAANGEVASAHRSRGSLRPIPRKWLRRRARQIHGAIGIFG